MTGHDLLTLVGRLDDAAGFDTPRERFRRYLVDRVTQPHHVRSILNDCQRTLGEQPQRILQDVVVLLGRFLGFEITFGTYQRSTAGVKLDGEWRSHERLHIVLEVRSHQEHAPDLASLERAVRAVAAPHAAQGSVLGLCVVARRYAGRLKLENLLAGEHKHSNLRIVSVRSLGWLAEAVHAGRVRHGDLLKILRSGVDLDFSIELLERIAASGQPPEAQAQTEPVPPQEQPTRLGSGYWVTALTDPDSAPEQILASVVGQRRILGVTYPGPRGGAVPGDWVCLYVPGKGILGHAQLTAIIDAGASVVRHSERFRRVFGLEHVDLYAEAVVPPVDIEQALTSGLAAGSLAGLFLEPVSREEFSRMTDWKERPSREDVPKEESKSA